MAFIGQNQMFALFKKTHCSIVKFIFLRFLLKKLEHVDETEGPQNIQIPMLHSNGLPNKQNTQITQAKKIKSRAQF